MSEEFILIQISDSHLFADKSGLHHNTNVYQNLTKVLNEIKQLAHVDAIVFTGDLTQDHSDRSYLLFAQAFSDSGITTPVYYLAGNHDEPELLKRYLVSSPFCQAKVIETTHWQVILVESKSETPAGKICHQQLEYVANAINVSKSQLLLTHHHPIDVGFFIDRHGLINKQQFQDFIDKFPSIAAIGCGHVHQALTLPMLLKQRTVSLFTCPATSIQFDMTSENACANGQPPGYRIFILAENRIVTDVVYV